MEKSISDYIPADAPILLKALLLFAFGFCAVVYALTKVIIAVVAIALGVAAGLYVFGEINQSKPETVHTFSGVFVNREAPEVADTIPELKEETRGGWGK